MSEGKYQSGSNGPRLQLVVPVRVALSNYTPNFGTTSGCVMNSSWFPVVRTMENPTYYFTFQFIGKFNFSRYLSFALLEYFPEYSNTGLVCMIFSVSSSSTAIT